MSEDMQAAENRRRGLAAALDPRQYDPRRAVDPATMDRVMRAQAAARAQAQATTTVAIATIVSLVTSAFAFVAAFAWNNAIQQLFDENAFSHLFGLTLDKGLQKFVFAVFVTIIAVIVIVALNRVARRLAAKSAIEATSGQ